MNKSLALSLLVLTILLTFSQADAQTWNSNAGGYNTGYGTVYGTFGLAQATQNMYNTMQMNMQRSIMRQAMIKKWGLAAVEKAEREARSGSKSGSKPSAAAGPKVEYVPPVPKNYGVFRPDPTVDTGKMIADALGETPAEKKLYTQIYTATKAAFETEAAANGWKNNIAGAFTFFVVSNATIYHGSEEPSADTVSALYQAFNQSFDEVPEFGKMTNRDKQGLYNTLIAFSGIPLAAYTEGKQNNDEATLKVASQLSGELIKLVLKVEPDRVRFANGGLVVNQ